MPTKQHRGLRASGWAMWRAIIDAANSSSAPVGTSSAQHIPTIALALETLEHILGGKGLPEATTKA